MNKADIQAQRRQLGAALGALGGGGVAIGARRAAREKAAKEKGAEGEAEKPSLEASTGKSEGSGLTTVREGHDDGKKRRGHRGRGRGRGRAPSGVSESNG